MTKAIADALEPFIPSDIQIAITGLTTRGGGETEVKPVGTMFIHIIINKSQLPNKISLMGHPKKLFKRPWIGLPMF